MLKSIASDAYEKLIDQLITRREQAGITQVQLAERIGETQSFVSKIERAERRIDLVELFHICRALNTSLLDFVSEFESAVERGTNGLR